MAAATLGLLLLGMVTVFYDTLVVLRLGAGYDFSAFWSASHLLLAGQGENIYRLDAIYEVAKANNPDIPGVYPWFYPPSFLPIVLPLSLLPFIPSLIVWNLIGIAFLAIVCWRLLPTETAVWGVLSTPLLLWTVWIGQSSLLWAAFFGLFALLFDRRPFLAGVCLGMLSYKPQFGVLIPFALIAGRNWDVFIGAVVSTVVLAVVGTGLCGFDCWLQFRGSLGFTTDLLEDSRFWHWMPSVYASLRLLGAGPAVAIAGHACVAVMCGLFVLSIWWRGAPSRIRIAALAAAALLITPRLFDYDLMLLAIPVVLLVSDALKTQWLRGEREVMFAAWLFPLLATILAIFTKLQLGWLVPLALLLIVWQRWSLYRPG